jgi:nucleotide-binding universal stress UspA family protein
MKILLPVDGSPLALDAVRHALDLATQGLRASFVLANVQAPSSLYELVVVHDADRLAEVARAAAADALAPAEALLRAAGVEYETEVATGDAGHQLVDIAEDHGCDAVVMAARGASAGLAALGSVAQAVLARSPVPVTIVRRVEPEVEPDEVDAGAEADMP